MFTRFWIAGVVMGVGVSIACAQRGPGGGPQGGTDDGGYAALSARPYQENRLDRLSDLLRLNKEQKNGAKEIFDAAQKEAGPSRDVIQKGRSAIATAYMLKRPQAEIDQMIAEYGKAFAEMTAIESRAFAKLFESLTPDQQKKAASAFQIMAGMFTGRDWK